MTYTLVQSLGSDAASSITLDGRTYPVPAVVEDVDGLRWYLVDGFLNLRAATYARAVSAGVVALLAPVTGGWAAITVEDFMESRTESSGSYSLDRGWAEFDDTPPSYADLLGITAYHIAEPDLAAEQDGKPSGDRHFVHLHTHGEHSPMDGLSKPQQIVDEVKRHGQRAVALTDHGNPAGHPMLAEVAGMAGNTPIFGVEAYLVDNRFRTPIEWWEDNDGNRIAEDVVEAVPKSKRREQFVRKTDQKEVAYGYYHLTLLAKDQVGLRNLWAATTESHRRDGSFYYNPRMDWDVLTRRHEGIIALTGCLRGPLAKNIVDGNEEKALENLARLMEIFGDDLYLEIMPNDMPEQRLVNERLVEYSREFGIPLVATVDSHYPTKDDFHSHQVWVSANTRKEIGDDSDLFSHDLGLYLKSEEEVLADLGYLGTDVAEEAVYNTGRIADMCTAEIPITTARPVFSREGGAERDVERLLDLCLSNWHLTQGKGYSQEEAEARFEHEFGLLQRKGFCGYFLQVADYVTAAKKAGCRVGPGRGSGGGSLVAYLSRITNIDPIAGNLLFDRFMTEGRTALPDFDVDFPTSWRPWVTNYIINRYGEDHVVRVGTHLRLKNKGVFAALFRTLKQSLPDNYWVDAEAISKIIGAAEAGSAGLGLKFEELMDSEAEILAPYMEKYPEIFRLAEDMVGILQSYGQHPAGLVVAEESLVDALPLRETEDGQMVSQFDMVALELMGYIKFDILTLRTLDTIQETCDLIKANRGIDINPDDWDIEYSDPQVWETFGDGHVLGVFQVETASGVRMCKDMAPVDIGMLSDVITLVRPGPKRSGLTALYLARHHGEEEVDYPDPRLKGVLADTYGCLLYQEQIMQTCMLLGGYDSNEADEVRKILGKKKVEKVKVAGEEFIERVVANGMDQQDAENLWDQMAEFAKYSFGKAHAWGYSVLAYWTAWLKVHYPVETFTSLLSTVDEGRIPEFVNEARRIGFSILPPDINESSRNFTCQGLNVRYGLEKISGLGSASVEPLLAGQPYSSFEDFRERAKVDSGKTMTLARVGAFDSLVPNRRGLETMLMREKTGEAARCVFVTDEPNPEHPYNLACGFDWASEPPPVNPRTGKTLKPKQVPKKCTKACRQYSAPAGIDIARVEPYTEGDIRDLEMEILGLHLSSTIWDTLDPEDRADFVWAAEQIQDGPEGVYPLAVTVSKIKRHTDRSNNEMCFLGLVTERGDLDVTVFSKTWVKYKDNLNVGDLRFVEVVKNDRGFNLAYLDIPTSQRA